MSQKIFAKNAGPWLVYPEAMTIIMLAPDMSADEKVSIEKKNLNRLADEFLVASRLYRGTLRASSPPYARGGLMTS